MLVDTDVLIDLALDRRPHSDAAGKVLDWLERRPGRGFVAWHSISNFYCLVAPRRGKDEARDFLVELTRFLEVAPASAEAVRQAAGLKMSDFEDALQAAAALACQAEAIVTRNVADYRNSPIGAVSPADVVSDGLLD